MRGKRVVWHERPDDVPDEEGQEEDAHGKAVDGAMRRRRGSVLGHCVFGGVKILVEVVFKAGRWTKLVHRLAAQDQRLVERGQCDAHVLGQLAGKVAGKPIQIQMKYSKDVKYGFFYSNSSLSSSSMFLRTALRAGSASIRRTSYAICACRAVGNGMLSDLRGPYHNALELTNINWIRTVFMLTFNGQHLHRVGRIFGRHVKSALLERTQLKSVF